MAVALGALVLGILQVILAGVAFWTALDKSTTLEAVRWHLRHWALPALLLVSGLAWLGLWIGAQMVISRPHAAAFGQWEASLTRQQALIGLVENGEFRILAPTSSAGGTARLTTVNMQEAVVPESGELDLGPYEGMVIVVRGHDGGGWIYGCEVTEWGGPLLTQVIRRVYDLSP
jgi:hypothetical protein